MSQHLTLGTGVLAAYTQPGLAPVAPQVEELVKSKLEKPKTLRQLASRHWAEIECGTLLFDRQQREAAALQQLTKQDVTAFFKVLAASGNTRAGPHVRPACVLQLGTQPWIHAFCG